MSFSCNVLTVALPPAPRRLFPPGKAANYVRGQLGLHLPAELFTSRHFVLRVPDGPLEAFRLHVLQDCALTGHLQAAFPQATITTETIQVDLSAIPCYAVTVTFETPTELKHHGSPFADPLFPILWARLRQRLPAAPLLTNDAITTSDLQITWQSRQRTSSRTGQTHPIGGFTGQCRYLGDLTAFAPWLLAAQYTGIGRQTLWGKGAMRIQIDGHPSHR